MLTSSSLKQNAACKQGDNGQHLGGRPQLQDGKQVGEVVSEDVACAGNCVQPLPGAGAANLAPRLPRDLLVFSVLFFSAGGVNQGC